MNACVRCFPLFTITGSACADSINLFSQHLNSSTQVQQLLQLVMCACSMYVCVLTCPDFAEGRLSQQHLNTRITITVTVTASIRTTATNPPMITAELSVSQYVSIVSVAIFSALTSDAELVIVINTAMNVKLAILCIAIPVEKVMGGLSVVPATLLALTVTV